MKEPGFIVLADPPVVPSSSRAGAKAAATAAAVSDDEPLYAARPKIYPQSVSGTFRRIKWAVLVVTLGVYYLLPFVRWDRGPGAPSQAVLVDFPGRRFYFFFIEIWPQEVYYLTGLLIIAAMTLFLMNAVAGRVWCGYLCPQTVWTDLFFAVERFFEGDRRARMVRDDGPWTADKILRKTGKHAVWLLIAWWTGGAWVLYFADAPTLVKDLATFQAPFIAYASIGVLTFTTYTLAGHMREQVCVYMCPWPRIQAALTDEYALNVTYRRDRGEPRASVKKSMVLRDKGLPAGDCVDCNQCVAVCPTGVDIRDGASLGCIQCGLCIDACDTVMAKIGRPERLIGYDTEVNIRRRAEGLAPILRLVRVRTLLYVGIIAIAGGIMLHTLVNRATLGISALHDRNPIFVQMADGSVRNGYTVRILNKQPQAREMTLALEGLPGAVLEIVGITSTEAQRHVVEVGRDQTRELRVLVTLKDRPPASTNDIVFVVTASGGGETARTADHFRGP
jgi:cytochrome c oxidase accessory protein FixG